MHELPKASIRLVIHILTEPLPYYIASPELLSEKQNDGFRLRDYSLLCSADWNLGYESVGLEIMCVCQKCIMNSIRAGDMIQRFTRILTPDIFWKFQTEEYVSFHITVKPLKQCEP